MTDLLLALERREVSPDELMSAARDRLADADGALNALVRTTEVELAPGPLHGIPTVLKDNLDLAGYPTREGSRAVPDIPKPSDSALTAELKALGLGILGKSTLPEFGLTATTEPLLTGPTRNPGTWTIPPGLFRRLGSARGRRRRADRPRQRRRRLDPHPGQLLRPGRAQALARARHGRGVREVPAGVHRRRRRGHTDRPGRRVALQPSGAPDARWRSPIGHVTVPSPAACASP